MEHKLKAPLPVQMSSWIGEQPASKAIRQGPELNSRIYGRHKKSTAAEQYVRRGR